jgi:hypothetical protein
MHKHFKLSEISGPGKLLPDPKNLNHGKKSIEGKTFT